MQEQKKSVTLLQVRPRLPQALVEGPDVRTTQQSTDGGEAAVARQVEENALALLGGARLALEVLRQELDGGDSVLFVMNHCVASGPFAVSDVPTPCRTP